MAIYNSLAVANWFIKKAKLEDIRLDQMKLVKLVYIAQGLGLAIGKPLFEERIEAWKYGPVIPNVYYTFKHYGLENIDDMASNNLIEANKPIVPDDDPDAHKILDGTWQEFKNLSGIQLSNWSHNQDGPWYQVWHGENGKNHNSYVIDDDLIGEYFRNIE